MWNPLKEIPKWVFLCLGGAAIIIVGMRTDFVRTLPERIRALFAINRMTVVDPVSGRAITVTEGAWNWWRETLAPLANIAASALDLVIRPFHLTDRQLKEEPGWATFFAIAAICGAASAVIGFYVKIKGNKPKAFYRDDFIGK